MVSTPGSEVMTKPRAIISGSLAYDVLMHTPGNFGDALPPAEGNATWLAAYIATSLQRCLGGCGGNIAYALHVLGGTPVLVGVVGADGDAYLTHLAALGISRKYIRTLPDCWTAQAYIVTDNPTNQLNFFHPGASKRAHEQAIPADDTAELAIVAPNGKDGMLQHLRTLSAQSTPTFFDPGQALSLFTAADLATALDLCDTLIVNASEHSKILEISGQTAAALTAQAGKVLVTMGADGSRLLRSDGDEVRSDAVPFASVYDFLNRDSVICDPTGCGDAYRGGLLYGMLRGWEAQACMQFASVVGSLCATHGEAQGYFPADAAPLETVLAIYQKHFGGAPV